MFTSFAEEMRAPTAAALRRLLAGMAAALLCGAAAWPAEDAIERGAAPPSIAAVKAMWCL